MTYRSLAKKIYNLLEKFFFKRNLVSDNIYFRGNLKKLNSTKKILLYFPYYEFMHFGDHLLFEPLMKALKNIGYEVYIMPIKQMEFYFLKLNYQLGNYNDFKEYDLIITKIEFIGKMKEYSNNILYIDTACKNIKTKLCNDIINKTLNFIGKEEFNFDGIPSILNLEYDVSSKFNLNSKQKYIIYNNYIDSGSFRINNKMVRKLEEFVKDFKDKYSYKIIHVGTKKDKEKDNKGYEFIDLDLRGKTTPEDLFGLVALKNIHAYVGFDNFLMHIFFMNKKKNYIMFRGRYLKSNEEYIKNYVNPPFIYNGDSHDLIEYVE